MAKLYVTEYANCVFMPNALGQVPRDPPNAEYVVDFTAGVANSPNFQPSTRMVRLHTDNICSISIGISPTATVTNGRWVAGQTEYRGVIEGGTQQVSVIQNT